MTTVDRMGSRLAQRDMTAANGAASTIDRAHAAGPLPLRIHETVEIRHLEEWAHVVRPKNHVLNLHSAAADPSHAAVTDRRTERCRQCTAKMGISIETALTDQSVARRRSWAPPRQRSPGGPPVEARIASCSGSSVCGPVTRRMSGPSCDARRIAAANSASGPVIVRRLTNALEISSQTAALQRDQ